MSRQKIAIKVRDIVAPIQSEKSEKSVLKAITHTTKSIVPIVPDTSKTNTVYHLTGITSAASLSGMKRQQKHFTNNIIQLKLSAADIKYIEEELERVEKLLLQTIDEKVEPRAWNDSFQEARREEPSKRHEPFGGILKAPFLAVTVAADTSSSSEQTGVNRKDLIIHSGIKRQTRMLMPVFSKQWPTHSPYVCWNDCHTFETTPVGIPHSLVDNTFCCYGNFCSYNCAKRYLCPTMEDDMSLLITMNDLSQKDDLSEKIQLLEMLCHLETDAPMDEPIKPAPCRLTLTTFGGPMSIEEYRASFTSNTTFHVFKFPLVPISYQLEEAINRLDTKTRPKCTTLDAAKIKNAYDSLTRNKTAEFHKILNGDTTMTK